MQILKGAITQLASEGHLTLQIPECAICFPGDPVVDMEEAPDEWFCVLKRDVPVLGKESGFLHLTRVGYEANKNALKAAFATACATGRDRTNGVGWPAFEKMAEEHFKKVEKATTKQKKLLAQKLDQLNGFVV